MFQSTKYLRGDRAGNGAGSPYGCPEKMQRDQYGRECGTEVSSNPQSPKPGVFPAGSRHRVRIFRSVIFAARSGVFSRLGSRHFTWRRYIVRWRLTKSVAAVGNGTFHQCLQRLRVRRKAVSYTERQLGKKLFQRCRGGAAWPPSNRVYRPVGNQARRLGDCRLPACRREGRGACRRSRGIRAEASTARPRAGPPHSGPCQRAASRDPAKIYCRDRLPAGSDCSHRAMLPAGPDGRYREEGPGNKPVRQAYLPRAPLHGKELPKRARDASTFWSASVRSAARE